MSVNEKMTAIADAIRAKTGGTDPLSLDAMALEIDGISTGAELTITVTVNSGSVVTAAKGEATVSGTSVDGVCVLAVPEGGEWVVQATLNGEVSTAEAVDVIGNYETRLVYGDPVFANNTWAKIIEVCRSGFVPDSWVEGDQKTMTIDGVDYAIDIIGKNHDDYADGSGKAPLTLQMHDCYATAYPMNLTASNAGGWVNSKMRTTHLPAILALMPSEVQAGIREVKKETSGGNKLQYTVSSEDKLFLLSQVEILGTNNYTVSGEGVQYAYYASGNGAVKKGKTGAATNWLGRSPYKNDTASFFIIAASGGGYYGGASTSYGVAFAFCF